MARKGLSISEALKVLLELPSDSESENAESSDTEEYVAELSDNSDVTDENFDDSSQPGPSSQPPSAYTDSKKESAKNNFRLHFQKWTK